jgi:magnesium transporter
MSNIIRDGAKLIPKPMRLVPRLSRKAGMPPATLVPMDEPKVEKVKITLFTYDEEKYEEKEFGSIEDAIAEGSRKVSWINIDGLHEVNVMEEIGRVYKVHPLVLEDILSTHQRPKGEEFEDYYYIVFRMLYLIDGEIASEQVSLLLGRDFVISFQERTGDVFEPIRDRIRKGKGRIRNKGPDYLAYALMDSVVDSYFSVLEHLGDAVEQMEERLVIDASPEALLKIQRSKRNLALLRKSIWPLREVLSGLERSESPLIKKETGIFIRDVYDHTIQVIDTVETLRDLVSGMLDIYLSVVSNKMNEVMKVLTIIATIFIPLTFIAGIYGMNFKYMPELEIPWGYGGVLATMVVVALVMVFYFRRKHWL